jgi:hypothetical protein
MVKIMGTSSPKRWDREKRGWRRVECAEIDLTVHFY